MRAVVMAGGKGKRLYPYTTVLPKPLMPVGDVPILDIVLRQISSFGFRRVTLACGYLCDLIKAYIGGGKRYGLKIDYSVEDKPLGTVGPLSLVKGLNDVFLVMNGDLLTDMNLTEMLKYHRLSKSIATVAVKKRRVMVDYGVIDFDRNMRILSHREKPVLKYHVGMGICFFEPQVLKFISKNRRFDFPDLVNTFVSKGIPMNVYKSNSYWRDVGRWEDYIAAQREFPRIKKRLLKAKRKKVA